MQIIIPMTGNGSRFREAGYSELKPFIKIHGKPLIEWVVKMFAGDEDKITFICRDEHLEGNNNYLKLLEQICPKAKIFIIKNWKKKGPVYDILKAREFIDDNLPVIVSYCDYYMLWNYHLFKKDVIELNCDGSVPCYSGFHPHLIPKANLYASCKVDSYDYLIEIKEKFSWEKEKTKARHSPGLYYFKSGSLMKYYFEHIIKINDSHCGEYYASLPFNYLVEDGLKVWCPTNINYFCQWGTPKDLEEYIFWTKFVKVFR